jgi:uncharacterized protein
LLVLVATVALSGAGSLFPGDRTGAILGRAAGYLAIVAFLIAGTVWLLKRDGLPSDVLGLAPSAAHARAFLLGILAACVLIAVLVAALYAAAPFEWRAGSRPASSVVLAALTYLCGNAGEELLFRGYAFIGLARRVGTRAALWLLALPFGLFHAPGLDALALGKMVLTTGAMHFVFAYAYLGTRSLWAAISLHAFANLLLHSVSGLGQGPAAFDVVLRTPPQVAFDLPFAVFLGSAVVVAIMMSRIPAVRRGAAWLEGDRRTP